MSTLFFKGMPSTIADQARASQKDAYGHTLRAQDDQTAPCRHCLRIARPGEPLLLLSYNPFGADHGPYSEVGPVFVHAGQCQAYRQTDSLPQDFRERELVLRAYNHNHAIEDSIIAQPGRAEETAHRLFENEAIAYIHVRHTTYGCFDFSIERG